MSSTRSTLHSEVSSLIERLASTGDRDDAARDALLLAIAHYQLAHVAPYARYASQRLAGRPIASVADVPALPTDAFRFARISSRDEGEDIATFRSSGTTQDARSVHPVQDLTLYDASARAAAKRALFPDVERIALIILAPHERELPDSSLSYMLSRFLEWFGSDLSTHVWPLEGPELERLAHRLRAAEQSGEPVALLGTSFAFVHALDALGAARFALPRGSRIMQTGGFKGRSRELEPVEMRTLLEAHFGVPAQHIVAEYGMTELSSQLYESTLRAAVQGEPNAARRLEAPAWVRVSVVHPETLAPLPHGEQGLVRIDDPANLDSVAFIQTADLGVFDGEGLTLAGRAPAAVARGCSITADELLSASRRS